MLRRILGYLSPFSDRHSLYSFAMTNRRFKEQAYDQLHSHFHCISPKDTDRYSANHGIRFFLEHPEHIARIRHVRLWSVPTFRCGSCDLFHNLGPKTGESPLEFQSAMYILKRIPILYSLQLPCPGGPTYPEELRKYIVDANPRNLFIECWSDDLDAITSFISSFRYLRTIILSFIPGSDDNPMYPFVHSEERGVLEEGTAYPLSLSLSGQGGYHFFTRENVLVRAWMSRISSRLLRLSLDLSLWVFFKGEDGKWKVQVSFTSLAYTILPDFSPTLEGFPELRELSIHVFSEMPATAIVEGLLGNLPPLLEKVEIWVSLPSIPNTSYAHLQFFTMLDRLLGGVREICIRAVMLEPDNDSQVWDSFLDWIGKIGLAKLSQRTGKGENLTVLLSYGEPRYYLDEDVVFKYNMLDTLWPAHISPSLEPVRYGYPHAYEDPLV